MDWVRRAGDYRVLVGKRDGLGYPLAEVEQARLDELERFFLPDANRRRLPWAQRENIRAPISIVVTVGDVTGKAQDISPQGIYVVTSARLPIGARTMVTISDGPFITPDGDEDPTVEEWRFPAEVVRLDVGGIGLRFVGIPLQLRLAHRPSASTSTVKDAA